MDLDLLDLYGRASDWTSTKVVGAASQLDGPTTCDGWDVRTLLNHMLQTQRYFVGAARGEPGVIDKTGPALAIAFSDQLLHGWDLALSTGRESTMPDGLPDAAYSLIHGRFTEEQRKGVFKPEILVGPDASAQDRLLAYTGRDPSPPA
ncbi:MAG TPA: maleylpyruvate isomerase N-terminal domain-containing protein [Acidimicrobiales bacterium]